MDERLEQLLDIQVLPVKDRLGTLKKAEILIDSRKAIGSNEEWKDFIENRGDYGSMVFDFSYDGWLKNGSRVRTVKYAVGSGKFSLPKDTDKALKVLEENSKRLLSSQAEQWYILPVYWFSEDLLPKPYKGIVYVDPLFIIPGEPNSPPFFRKIGLPIDPNYMAQFQAIVPKESRLTYARRVSTEEREETSSGLTLLRGHAERLTSRQIISNDRDAILRRDTNSRILLDGLDSCQDPEFVLRYLALTDPTAILAQLLLENQDHLIPGTTPDGFDEASREMYRELSLGASKVVREDEDGNFLGMDHFLSSALTSALNSQGSSNSISANYGKFGGGERRRLRN